MARDPDLRDPLPGGFNRNMRLLLAVVVLLLVVGYLFGGIGHWGGTPLGPPPSPPVP
jgi:hypothetical protein